MELKGMFRRHPLDTIFAPRNVAVIGATEKEDSVGRTLLWNLISNPFGGTVFPVNPKRNNVMGIRSYPSIGDVPDQVDLAVIVTPAPTVPMPTRATLVTSMGGEHPENGGTNERKRSCPCYSRPPRCVNGQEIAGKGLRATVQ